MTISVYPPLKEMVQLGPAHDYIGTLHRKIGKKLRFLPEKCNFMNS